ILGGGTIATILGAVVGIAILISSIAVGIKRLHDRNKSGWFLLIFYLVPGILAAIGVGMALVGLGSDSTGASLVGMILNLAAAAVGIWAFVELGCLRGTVGPNQYGPDPVPPGA